MAENPITAHSATEQTERPALKGIQKFNPFRRLARLGTLAFFSQVSFGTLAIVAICMVDMFLTLAAVLSHKAVEANPMLAWSFAYGPMAFVLVKAASFMPGIWAIEMCRLHNARFASMASRAVVYGYMAVYLFGSLRIHNLI